MSKNIIELADVWEKYRIKFVDHNRVSWDEFWALEGIDLQVAQGEILGIIGENGAGKTTLLKIISGMLIPDKGKVDVRGRVSVLMELGAGFNQEFTGRENIMLNTRMYGVAEDILEEQVKRIIDFADLGRFIDAPIKHYSQGMYMRLAFALAIFVEPDILLIDDILAVGDEEARQKCIKKIIELKDAGKNIILVSHDMDTVKHLCHRVILIEKGKVIKQGDAKQVIQYYLDNIGNRKGILSLQQDGLRLVFNNGRISISYNEVPVSKGAGGYVVFLNPGIDSWASSRDLSWEVKDSSLAGFTAEGTLEDGTPVQVWTIRFSEGKLSWNVEIKNHSLADQHIDLFLDPQYTKWFSLEDEKEFPFFIHKTRWQETGFQKGRCQFLAIGQKEPAGSNPGIIFEPGNNNIQLQILNTGYEQESRVLQVYPDAQDNISINLKFFLSQNKFQEYIRAFRERHLLKQKAEQEKLLTERTLTHGDIRLFVDVDHKMIRLYYRDKEVTKGCGLHSSFLLNRKWHDFVNFSDWRVSKNNDTLFLRLNQRSPELEQNWKISLAQDKLIWEVESSSGDSFSPEMFKLGLLLSNDYSTFFCGDQESAFPKEFTVWQDIPLENPRARLLGLKRTANLPAVTMLNNDNLDCIIQNSDLSSSSRVIQLGLDKSRIGNKQKILFATQINFSQDNSQIDSYLKAEQEKLLTKQKAEQEKLLTERTLTHGDIRLFVDVDHKMVRLYYRDREVTTGCGLHSSFLLNRQWHDFVNFSDWRVIREGDSLILSLDLKSPELKQNWKISLARDKVIWEAETSFQESFVPEMLKQGLLLNKEYAVFFCGHQESAFPKEFTVWQDIPLENPRARLLGLKRTANLPAVTMLNNDNLDCIIQNSDLSSSSRVIQLGLDKSRIGNKQKILFATQINFSQDNSQIDSYLKAEQEKLLTERTLTHGDIRLSVDVDHKMIRLYYRDKEVTRGHGLHSSFLLNRQWSEIKEAQWSTRKISPRGVSLVCSYPEWPFLEIWEFSVTPAGSIGVRVDIESAEETAFDNFDVRLQLSTDYEGWATTFEKGNLAALHFIDNIAPVRLKESKISQMMIIPGENYPLPRVLFKSTLLPENRIFGVYRVKEEQEELICVNSSLIIPKRKAAVFQKRRNYFAGEIFLGKEAVFDQKEKPSGISAGIKKDKLNVFFDQGRGRIEFDGRELSSGLHVYTSLRSGGIWYDSYQAVWKLIDKSPTEMVFSGDWPYIPVSQIWRFKLEKNNLIFWEVEMEVYKEAALEIEQSNLMLSTQYTNWEVPGSGGGEFPAEFTSQYDILPFRSYYGTAKELIAVSPGLPRVFFVNIGGDPGSRVVVENSDDFYSSRLLQFQRTNPNKLKSGKYPYFKGEIRVER